MDHQEIIEPDHDETTGGLPVTIDAGMAVRLARAEIDHQIATAHAFPRKLSLVMQNILSLVTIDQESATECIYSLPRGGKPIIGPSIRMAEIIASQWGNARVGNRVVDVNRTEKYVEAEGVFHDLQTNMATTSRVRRRISTKNGKVFDDDMIIVTGNAAASIAKRNAILGGVPKAIWRKAYAHALQVVAGDIKTLSVRREGALRAFATFGVKPEQVFEALGVAGIEDIGIDAIPVLIGMHSSLKNGEATVEEMFPPKQAATPALSIKDKMDALAGTGPKEDIDPETGEIRESAPKKATAAKARPQGRVEIVEQRGVTVETSDLVPAATKEERIATNFAREVANEVNQSVEPARQDPPADPNEMPSFLRRSAPKTNGGFSAFSDDA